MAIITKIVEARNKKRSSIYLDDVFVCFLDNFTIYKHKLKVGDRIDNEKLQTIQFESEQGTAFDMAVKYLSKYQKSKKEIRNYLIEKGFFPSVVDKVMEKIEYYKYTNDEYLAKSIVGFQSQKYGKQKLRFVLKNRGIGENEIEKALETIEGEREIAFNVAKKHIKNKELTPENIQKTGKFLLSRGFCWEDVSVVLNQLKKENENESWNWYCCRWQIFKQG